MTRRLRIPIGVAYGSDARQVEEILLQVAGQDSDVCNNPPPNVRLVNFGASSLDFELRCWIPEPSLKGLVLSRLNVGIYEALNKNDVKIPFPQQDLYLKEVPASLLEALQKLTVAGSTPATGA